MSKSSRKEKLLRWGGFLSATGLLIAGTSLLRTLPLTFLVFLLVAGALVGGGAILFLVAVLGERGS